MTFKTELLNQPFEKKRRPVRRTRRTGHQILATAGVATALVGGAYGLSKHNHIKSADTMAAVKAEVGHVPAGIRAIKPTETPGVVEVKYIVQPEVEDQLVSSVAADMHPVAPNQDPQSEFTAIETYTGGTSHLFSGEQINMLVNTEQGQILPNPADSAAGNG